MADISNYLKNKLNDHVLGVATYAAPTPYLALYTVAPTATTAGTELPNGVGYSRKAVTFGAASNGSSNNNALVTFGPCTTTNWGTVVAAAIVDSPTVGAGNVLYFKTLDQPRDVKIGDRFEFNVGTVIAGYA